MYKIKSLENYIETLKDIHAGATEEFYVYRGHADKSYKLEPSIYRNEGLIENEHNIFREIIASSHEEFSSCKTTLEKLVIMQHYSLPTRLLDMTTSPLVALYFACKNEANEEKDKDGEVVLLNIPKENIKYYDSDTISLMSNIATLSPVDCDLSNPIIEMQSEQYLMRAIKDAENLKLPNQFGLNNIKDIYCVKTILNNKRIINQNGCFLIFGVKGKKCSLPDFDPYWLLTRDEATTNTKIIIEASHKKSILDQLKTVGFDEGFLFPEIDNKSKMIKERFSKKT